MRQGFQNQGIVYNDKNELIAVCLGADFCAEHEWGFKPLKDRFGIDDSKIGVEKRVVTKMPKIWNGVYKNLHWFCSSSSFDYKSEIDNKTIKYYLDIAEYSLKDKDIVGFWDDHGFLFIVKDKQIVDETIKAFLNLDACIMLGGQGVFNNDSLNIIIRSRIPEETAKMWKDADEDRIALMKAFEKTGIEKKLEEAGKRYYGLSPRWEDDSKKELSFWLNPKEQKENNYGWYTLLDLKDWAKGKGKIPIKTGGKR